MWWPFSSTSDSSPSPQSSSHVTQSPQQLQPSTHQNPPSTTHAQPIQQPTLDSKTRRKRQNGLLFGGLAFTALSLFITRRALTRRARGITSPTPTPTKTKRPHTSSHEPSHKPQSHSDSKTQSTSSSPQASQENTAAENIGTQLENAPAFLAFEALTLATLNIFSLAITSIGAGLWFLDIASMEELKVLIRGGMVEGGGSKSEQEVEEEMEEWVAGVLARRDEKEGRVRLREANEGGRVFERDAGRGGGGGGKGEGGNEGSWWTSVWKSGNGGQGS